MTLLAAVGKPDQTFYVLDFSACLENTDNYPHVIEFSIASIKHDNLELKEPCITVSARAVTFDSFKSIAPPPHPTVSRSSNAGAFRKYALGRIFIAEKNREQTHDIWFDISGMLRSRTNRTPPNRPQKQKYYSVSPKAEPPGSPNQYTPFWPALTPPWSPCHEFVPLQFTRQNSPVCLSDTKRKSCPHDPVMVLLHNIDEQLKSLGIHKQNFENILLQLINEQLTALSTRRPESLEQDPTIRCLTSIALLHCTDTPSRSAHSAFLDKLNPSITTYELTKAIASDSSSEFPPVESFLSEHRQISTLAVGARKLLAPQPAMSDSYLSPTNTANSSFPITEQLELATLVLRFLDQERPATLLLCSEAIARTGHKPGKSFSCQHSNHTLCMIDKWLEHIGAALHLAGLHIQLALVVNNPHQYIQETTLFNSEESDFCKSLHAIKRKFYQGDKKLYLTYPQNAELRYCATGEQTQSNCNLCNKAADTHSLDINLDALLPCSLQIAAKKHIKTESETDE